MKFFDFFNTTRTTFSSMNEKFDELDKTHADINKIFDSIDDNFRAINKSFDNIEDNLKNTREYVNTYINLTNHNYDKGCTFTKILRWDDPKVLSTLRTLFELPPDTEIIGINVGSDGIGLCPLLQPEQV